MHTYRWLLALCQDIYLKANTSITGNNDGPITLEMKIDESCARLVLQSRVISKKRHQMVVDTSSWVAGREVYFIRCARRYFRKEGFLCMKFKPSQNGLPPYRLKIVSSTEKHGGDHFMLFPFPQGPTTVGAATVWNCGRSWCTSARRPKEAGVTQLTIFWVV